MALIKQKSNELCKITLEASFLKQLDKDFWKKFNENFPEEWQLSYMLDENKTTEVGQFDEAPYHKFLWIKSSENNLEDTNFHVKEIDDLYWQNNVDNAHPYSSGLQLSDKYLNSYENREILWTYMEENHVQNNDV